MPGFSLLTLDTRLSLLTLFSLFSLLTLFTFRPCYGKFAALSVLVGTKLIDKLVDGVHITMDEIESVYHRKLQASKEELLEACNGVITEHHSFMLRAVKRSIKDTQALIDDIDARIKEMLSPYDNVLELLRGVPGIDTRSAEDLIAEVGLDMSVFPNEKHLASWVGIAPGNNESAGKKKADE